MPSRTRTLARRIAQVAAVAAAVIVASTGASADSVIAWRGTTEIAAGGGERGAWQQNASRYDFVDDPAVALDAHGNAALVWVDQRRKDVLFRWIDAGDATRRTPVVNVSRTPDVFSWLPRIVLSPASKRRVFVLWQEIVFSGGSHGGDILFVRSTDGGRTFDAPLNLSRSVGGDGKGRITRDVWHNGSHDLALAANGALHAAWTEYDGALWVSRSTDDGRTFTAPLQVGGDRERPARAPALAPGPGATLYLAWTVGEDPAADVRVARSMDGGRTFAPPVLVSASAAYSDAPKLAVDRHGTVHVAYAESSGGPFERYRIRYARSRDGARTFAAGRDISGADGEGAAFPSLAVDLHDRVCIVWERYPDVRSRPRGLGFACSADGGDMFGAPAPIPGTASAQRANGGLEGLLMNKVAINGSGAVAVVNSQFEAGAGSSVVLVRGRLTTKRRGKPRRRSRHPCVVSARGCGGTGSRSPAGSRRRGTTPRVR